MLGRMPAKTSFGRSLSLTTASGCGFSVRVAPSDAMTLNQIGNRTIRFRERKRARGSRLPSAVLPAVRKTVRRVMERLEEWGEEIGVKRVRGEFGEWRIVIPKVAAGRIHRLANSVVSPPE